MNQSHDLRWVIVEAGLCENFHIIFTSAYLQKRQKIVKIVIEVRNLGITPVFKSLFLDYYALLNQEST